MRIKSFYRSMTKRSYITIERSIHEMRLNGFAALMTFLKLKPSGFMNNNNEILTDE